MSCHSTTLPIGNMMLFTMIFNTIQQSQVPIIYVTFFLNVYGNMTTEVLITNSNIKIYKTWHWIQHIKHIFKHIKHIISFLILYIQQGFNTHVHTQTHNQTRHHALYCCPLVEGYTHNNSKAILSSGRHFLAGRADVLDGVVQVVQVGGDVSLVHWRQTGRGKGQVLLGILFWTSVRESGHPVSDADRCRDSTHLWPHEVQ